MLNYILVIPARLKSSRLKNKPLLKIKKIPMIIRTAMKCNTIVDKSKILIATDSKKIIKLCKENNFNSILTSKKCQTGTDRVFEVSKKIKANYYINVQGDEPILNPNDLKKMIKSLPKKNNKEKVFLGYCKFKSKKIMLNKNIPKVIFDKKKKLIYASRAPIPSQKNTIKESGFRQILIYVYSKEVFKKFEKLYNKKSFLEQSEDIEILRFIENNIDVKLIKMSNLSKSVDTLKDLKEVEKLIKN